MEVTRKEKHEKEDLRLMIGVSSATLARLGKNQTVSMDVLGKICKALKCDVGDIVAYMRDNNVENKDGKR